LTEQWSSCLGRPGGRALLLTVVAAMSVALAVMLPDGGRPAGAAAELSLYTGSESVRGPGADDRLSVELGTVFSVAQPGAVTALRFYKTSANTGTHTGTLWGANGARLARATFTGETATGWQTARLSAPVTLDPGRSYTVSYHAPVGRYAVQERAFADGATLGNPVIRATAGVYRYGAVPAFPRSTWNASAYYVDVLFAPSSSAPPAPPNPVPSTTRPSSPAPSTTRPSSPAPSTTRPSSPAPTTTRPSSPAPTTTRPSSPAPTTTPPLAAACQFDGGYVWANLEACGWAGPSNTGPASANCPGGLTANSGALTRTIRITAPSTVLSCQRITGCIEVAAANVVLRDVEVTCSSGRTGEEANGTGVVYVAEGASATVERARLHGSNATHACIWHQGTAMTATTVDCSGVNDGVFSWAYTRFSQTTGDDFIIRDSYFHDFTSKAANGHADGYQTEGAGNGLMEHNTFLMTSDARNESNSAIAIWNSLRSSHDITVRGNLIAGGGFAVYAQDYNPSEASPSGGASVTNIRFLDNVFSTRLSGCVGTWGVWFTRGAPTDGWIRSGNRVLETGQNIDDSNPTNNGRVCF
jgi:hypothetical protein